MSKILNINEKLACVTLDFEEDYGHRIGNFNILENNESDIFEIAKLFSDIRIPVSAFIVTELLRKYEKSLEIIKMLAKDYHCHSHTHNIMSFDRYKEISLCSEVFERYFGYKAIGYRAPQGNVCDADIDMIKQYGFKFSASIFPSFRPGIYNNLTMPIYPFMYNNGIIELPFSVVPKLRYVVSLSYLKLLGMNKSRFLFVLFGLPSIVVFDSHLHDFIVNEESFSKLPKKLKKAWGRNKYMGIECFKFFVELLKKKRYHFITMTDLYNFLKE